MEDIVIEETTEETAEQSKAHSIVEGIMNKVSDPAFKQKLRKVVKFAVAAAVVVLSAKTGKWYGYNEGWLEAKGYDPETMTDDDWAAAELLMESEKESDEETSEDSTEE